MLRLQLPDKRRATTKRQSKPGITIVTSGETIYPITDDRKRELQFVDAEGRPKKARVDLRPTDPVTVIQYELYQSKHACDLCATEGKSQRVLLLENRRTGAKFYAAGNCLRFHFDLQLEAFHRSTHGIRSHLEMIAKVLKVSIHADTSTTDALHEILARFDAFVAFDCPGVRECRSALSATLKAPGLAARGEFDTDLRAVSSLVRLHDDFRHNATRFHDRWRALLGHPLRKERTDWPIVALETAAHRPHELRLPSFDVLLDSLDTAKNHRIELRNPQVLPWKYSDRQGYHQALHDFFQCQSPGVRARRFRVTESKDMRKLGDLLLKDLERKVSRTFVLEALSRSQLEKDTLPNQDTLLGRALIARSEIKADRTDRNARCFVQVASVYFVDGWHDAYSIWHLYGREELESLIDTSHRQTDLKSHMAPLAVAYSEARATMTAYEAEQLEAEAMRKLDVVISIAGEPAQNMQQYRRLRKLAIRHSFIVSRGHDREILESQQELEQAFAGLWNPSPQTAAEHG